MKLCLVCKTNEVHVNYEFMDGNGFCSDRCEDRFYKYTQDAYENEREYSNYERDDMFSDAMELDPSDRI